MAYYVVTYTPLAASDAGLEAVRMHGHPPYADASCRREPDLEAVYPSITCVCRGANFAPRLRRGDTVVYLTMKGTYPGVRGRHWRLVAVLRVMDVFATHAAAAAWHRERGFPLPNDCLVPGNHPLPLDHTNRAASDVAVWDHKYQERVAANGTMAICEPLWIDLHHPPVVTDAMMLNAFGRRLATRNPPAVSEGEVRALLAAATVTVDGSHVRRPATPARPQIPAGAPTRPGSACVACGSTRPRQPPAAARSRRGCA